MSRSGYGYHDDLDEWALIRWRGAVASALRGRRGQAFLREMLAALDAMPNKRLIRAELVRDGEVCAIGAVCAARGLDVSDLDSDDHDSVSARVGLADAMVREIAHVNDERAGWINPGKDETPEERWTRMRAWVAKQIRAQEEKEIR